FALENDTFGRFWFLLRTLCNGTQGDPGSLSEGLVYSPVHLGRTLQVSESLLDYQHRTLQNRTSPAANERTFILSATWRPSSYLMYPPGTFFSSSSSPGSRRSHFKATSTSFTPWQFSAISPIHFDSTFSSESRESTCKTSDGPRSQLM